jgi:hypothetical protein
LEPPNHQKDSAMLSQINFCFFFTPLHTIIIIDSLPTAIIPPPPKVMDTLCSCGEDLALAEMFDEPLIVVARPRKQIDTSTSRRRRRLLESKRGEPLAAAAEQEDWQGREDTECVDVPGEDNVRDIVEIKEREEVEQEPAKEENNGGRNKLRFGLAHRSLRNNKRQSKNQKTPNNRFVQDMIGQSTKKKGVVRENSWVDNNQDSFLDFGEEDVGLIEMLDEADDDLETDVAVQNKAPPIERSTWQKPGYTNNTIDGQEYTAIETIYEEMEPRQPASWFTLMTMFFSRRHKSKQQTTKQQQQGETTGWPVDTDLVMLLEQACRRIGRPNDDVMPYMTNLHQDRYDDIDSLSGKSISSLGKYMPLRLAEAVVMLLREDDAVLVEEATSTETWACNETKGWVHQNGGILLLTDEYVSNVPEK